MDLFTKEKISGKSGYYALIHTPSNAIEALTKEALDIFMSIEIEDSVVQGHTGEDFVNFKVESIIKMIKQDQIKLLTNTISLKDGSACISLNRKDDGYTRVYSTFNAIKKESRKVESFHGADLGTGQQVTMMNVLENAGVDTSKYVLHWELISDKKTFRTNLISAMGILEKEVKQAITSIDNGQSLDSKDLRHYKKLLQPYKLEAELFIDEFLETCKTHHHSIYLRAVEMAKMAKDYHVEYEGKKKISILYFLWTQFERPIREAMKSCYTEPVYDVHDAVYSREQVDTKILEEAVLDQTGFRVKIEEE